MRNKILVLDRFTRGASRGIVDYINSDGTLPYTAFRAAPNGSLPSVQELVDVGIAINYGCVDISDRLVLRLRAMGIPLYNEDISLSSDKTAMFTALGSAGVQSLVATVSRAAARSWTAWAPVFCRTLSRGSRGRGIVIAYSPEEVVAAPLYTLGMIADGDNLREYRVYVMGSRVLGFIEKRRFRTARLRDEGIDPEDRDAQLVRSHSNGWVFARNTMDCNAEQKAHIAGVGVLAVRAVQLDFGAADILVRYVDDEISELRVIETNSCLGAEDTNTREMLAKSWCDELVTAEAEGQ